MRNRLITVLIWACMTNPCSAHWVWVYYPNDGWIQNDTLTGALRMPNSPKGCPDVTARYDIRGSDTDRGGPFRGTIIRHANVKHTTAAWDKSFKRIDVPMPPNPFRYVWIVITDVDIDWWSAESGDGVGFFVDTGKDGTCKFATFPTLITTELNVGEVKYPSIIPWGGTCGGVYHLVGRSTTGVSVDVDLKLEENKGTLVRVEGLSPGSFTVPIDVTYTYK